MELTTSETIAVNNKNLSLPEIAPVWITGKITKPRSPETKFSSFEARVHQLLFDVARN